MITPQIERLIKAYPSHFNRESATKAVARAYGYHNLNQDTGELSDPVAGLQQVRPYDEFLHKDPTHQVIDLMRMALNLGLPDTVDFRQGIEEKTIVSTMIGFANFDSIINYARSDILDPNTTDKDVLARFEYRYGYKAPIQYLLGLYTAAGTLVIQPDTHLAHRIIDQEIGLNPLEMLKVVVLRTDPDGDKGLIATQSRNVASHRGQIDPEYGQSLYSAMGDKPVAVSMVPDEEYSLHALVSAHLGVLDDTDGKSGHTLIIDQLQLKENAEDHRAAFALAKGNNIHLVVMVNEPNADLWLHATVKLIFGFTDWDTETLLDMDKYLAYAAPYVGFYNGKMQYLYVSEESGPRYGAMDYIPDEPQAKTLKERITDVLTG